MMAVVETIVPLAYRMTYYIAIQKCYQPRDAIGQHANRSSRTKRFHSHFLSNVVMEAAVSIACESVHCQGMSSTAALASVMPMLKIQASLVR
jgi:hypothetical protein